MKEKPLVVNITHRLVIMFVINMKRKKKKKKKVTKQNKNNIY
jgi:hypothetical protein